VLRHVCYETSQRWLKHNAPSLHHGALPTLAAFSATGQLLSDADLDTLLDDSAMADGATAPGGGGTGGVLAFLHAAEEEAAALLQSAAASDVPAEGGTGSETDGG